MIEEYADHENAVGRAAIARLAAPEAYPGLPPLKQSEVILRLLRFDGLGAYCVWILSRAADRYVVRRVVWDRSRDAQPGAVDPTTYGSDALVVAADVEADLTALHDVSVRLFLPKRMLGVDGVTFGVEYGGSWRTARLYWWSSGSAHEWQARQDWFDMVVARFDRVLPPRE
jgi:hypothetical protein